MAKSKAPETLDKCTEGTDVKQASAAESCLDDVISIEEIGRFRDLGLGRGVDVTNPNIWTDKSPFIMMHICPDISNVIGTEEGGIKQYFTEEISSLTNLQMGIKLSLNEPSSQIKIGMNAEDSRGKSSTRKTAGAKVHTRTVSFREELSDLPIHSLSKTGRLQLLEASFPKTDLEVPENFESQLYRWILDRIYADVQDRSHSKVTEDVVPNLTKLFKGETPVEQLSSYLETLERGSPQLKLIASYCTDFVRELGITHYVNAIDLGAMTYQSFTLHEYQKKFGAGVNVGVAQLAQASASGKYESKNRDKSTKLQQIGKIPTDRDIKRNSSEESVIGFQIQPIHKLVQLLYINVGLQKAVKDFVDKKSDKSEGPFLISGKVSGTQVYWTVNKQCQLVGTPHVQRASPLYVIPTESKHPFEFMVAYYEESKDARSQPRSLDDPTIELSTKQAPLPRYLTSNPNMFGFSSQPSKLTSSTYAENAHYFLEDKLIQSSSLCFSVAPVSPAKWIQGDEFYISCNHRVLKIDGYLAMKRDHQKEESDHDRADSLYTTVVVSTKLNSVLGMLFRLHPVDCRDIPQNDTTPEQLEPEGEVSEYKPIPEYVKRKGKISTEPGNEDDIETISGAAEHSLVSSRPHLKSGYDYALSKHPPLKQSEYISSYDSQYEHIFGSN